MSEHKKHLEENGFVIIKRFFDKNYLDNLRNKAKAVFQIQFENFGLNESFDQNMIKLFENHNEVFINCGKIIQAGLIELYKLPVEDRVLELMQELGLEFPNMCTRPILFFNHPKLAKQEVYYKTPPHQDWSSMQSSMNSVVLWVPLLDVGRNNGSILVWPKSHKLGILDYETVGGFAGVQMEEQGLQTELELGDIAVFSTLLVHSSGDILDNTIRWSCHFRYTDMHDKDFIQRGFPNPYIYKPEIKKD